MPSLFYLTKPFFRVSLIAGAIAISAGLLLLLFVGTNSPAIVLLAFGDGELIMSLSGYMVGNSSQWRTKTWPYVSGIILAVAGIALCYISIFMPSFSDRLGIGGLSVFAPGIPLIIARLSMSRPMNLKGLVAVGIGVTIAGIPVAYLYGFVPSMNDLLYLSILPALSGLEIIASTRIIRGFGRLDKTVTVSSGS